MATAYTSNVNITHMNRKQVRAIARNLGVREESQLVTTSSLRTAIKLK